MASYGDARGAVNAPRGRSGEGGRRMRLTDEVYLVGGGPVKDFGLSNEPDCHVYLIDGGDELALVDCGMAEGDSLERILSNVQRDELDPARIRTLILTHYHMDHAGG